MKNLNITKENIGDIVVIYDSRNKREGMFVIDSLNGPSDGKVLTNRYNESVSGYRIDTDGTWQGVLEITKVITKKDNPEYFL